MDVVSSISTHCVSDICPRFGNRTLAITAETSHSIKSCERTILVRDLEHSPGYCALG